MIITARFKIYDHIVCASDRKLYQLEHFKNKRTFPFKELTYNPDRKAYRINSQWVSKKRLYKFMYKTNQEIKQESTVLERLISDLSKYNNLLNNLPNVK